MVFISSCCCWFQEVRAGSMKIQPPRLYSGEVCCVGIRSESSRRAIVKKNIDSRTTGGREALAINTAYSTNFIPALLLHQSFHSVWTTAIMFMQDLLLSVHIKEFLTQLCGCILIWGFPPKKVWLSYFKMHHLHHSVTSPSSLLFLCIWLHSLIYKCTSSSLLTQTEQSISSTLSHWLPVTSLVQSVESECCSLKFTAPLCSERKLQPHKRQDSWDLKPTYRSCPGKLSTGCGWT